MITILIILIWQVLDLLEFKISGRSMKDMSDRAKTILACLWVFTVVLGVIYDFKILANL